MSIQITLNFIRENWSSATRAMDRRAFCMAVLPDCYDYHLCRSQGDHFFHREDPSALSDQTINGLMRGNRKSAANTACASVAFTKDLLGKLQNNTPIVFRDPKRPGVPCVDNMVGKIREQVRKFSTPRDRSHPLFLHADYGTLGHCDETVEIGYRKIRLAVDNLLERNTETSLSYAIFLLVVTAILQDRVLAVEHLYSMKTIEQILDSDSEAPKVKVDSRRHIPFTDRDYMNEYHVYLYHDTSNALFNAGRLSMTLDDRGQPLAALAIHATVESPISGHQEVVRVFTGMPMLSQADRIVYAALVDQTDSLIYLTFSHTPFSFAPMYFRSALLVSTEAETKAPQVQRVAIVARDLTPEELPYIQGLLKTTGKQLMLTQRQLELFQEKFADYPWMEDFKTNYLPIFETHLRPVYCFNEDELLACSASDLPYPERLRILLALRSMDPPNDNTLHKFLRSTVPSKTHSILK